MSAQIDIKLVPGDGSILVKGRLSRKTAHNIHFQPPRDLYDRVKAKTIAGSESAVLSALIELGLNTAEEQNVNLIAEVK